MKKHLFAGLSGLVFGLGLGLSGMTQPARVIGFLDLFGGRWDPTLAFVMMSALAVHTTLNHFVLRRPAPLFAQAFSIPKRRDIDARLVVGSALFGVGWGIAGFCPGPALVQVGTLAPGALLFSAAMVAGMALKDVVAGEKRPASNAPSAPPSAASGPADAVTR